MRSLPAILIATVAIVSSAFADSYTLDLAWPSEPLPADVFEVTAVAVAASSGQRYAFVAQRNASAPMFFAFSLTTGRIVNRFNWTGVMTIKSPHGMSANNNSRSLWVADIGGCSLYEVRPEDGFVLTGEGSCGNDTLPAQFSAVADIAVAANGDLITADGDGGVNSRVMRVVYGVAVWATGTNGTGVGHFNSPHAVAVDARGRVWVADRGNSRIVVLDATTGAWLGEWDAATCFPGGTPWGLRVDDARGNLLMVDGGTGTLFVFDLPSLPPPTSACVLKASYLVPDGASRKPHELGVDEETGDVYIALAGSPPGVVRYTWVA